MPDVGWSVAIKAMAKTSKPLPRGEESNGSEIASREWGACTVLRTAFSCRT